VSKVSGYAKTKKLNPMGLAFGRTIN